MRQRLVITGVGALSSYGLGVEAFAHGYGLSLPSLQNVEPPGVPFYTLPQAARVTSYDARKLLNTKGIRSLDRLTVHVAVALDLLHRDLGFDDLDTRRAHYPDEEVSLALGSSGPLQSILAYDLDTISDPRFVQPGLFPNAVFSLPASYGAIRRAIKGSCITLTNGVGSALDCFSVAAMQFAMGRTRLAIVGGAEELTTAQALSVAAVHREWGEECPPVAEGVALFAVEDVGVAAQRGARSLAEVLAVHAVFCPDAAVALAECSRRVCESVPQVTLTEIAGVYANRELDLEPLGLGRVPFSALSPRLGYQGAMGGAFGVLSALADPQLEAGGMALVICSDGSGSCSMLLLKKMAALQRSEDR